MAISYNVADNIITVTGYSEATPANFTDIYNTDKAGTLSLHARTGITAVDGATVAVDRAERPADYVVLGGASNDLYITIANWVGTTATIQITGTDRAGNALTEDIVVTANGTYYTTKLFKTITHTQVTVFTATSFDYDLTQGQWGVVWKLSETLFRTVGISITLGDAGNDAYFGDIKKTIEVYQMPEGAFYFNSPLDKGHLYLGEAASVSEKTGKNGCLFMMKTTEDIMDWGFTRRLADLYMYDTKIVGDYGVATMMRLEGTDGRIWESSFTRMYLTSVAGNLDVYNVIISDGILGLNAFSTTGEIDKLQILDNTYTVIQVHKTISSTWKNLYVRNFTNRLFFVGSGTTADHYVIDADVDWSSPNINWSSSPDCEIYRQYTFNLKVTDKDGNNINGASVKIWDKDNNLVVDTTTSSGVITEQTISRGYYNQANGNTLQEYSPHTIQISKAGYQTYTKKFTLLKKVDWVIRLRRITEINLSKRCRINM